MPKDKKLEQLKNILDIIDNSITKEEFLKAFENVVKLVEKTNAQSVKDMNGVKDLFLKMEGKLKSENKSDITSLKGEVERLFNKAHREQVDDLNFVKDTVKDNIKDTEKRLTKDFTSMLPEEFIHPSPEAHRDELESFKGKERLNMSAIDGLIEALEEIKEQRLGKSGGGTSAMGVRWALGRINNTETPTGLVNGTNKVYTVLNEIHTVFSFGINGMVIHSDEYTIAGRKITFGTALPAALSGKSFEIIYV